MTMLAAPEEHRNFKDYAMACQPSLKDAWAACKSLGWYPEFQTAKQWYDWCWAQPEAAAIHKAFQ